MGAAAGEPCGGAIPMKQISHLLCMLLPLSFSGMKGFFASGSSGELKREFNLKTVLYKYAGAFL